MMMPRATMTVNQMMTTSKTMMTFLAENSTIIDTRLITAKKWTVLNSFCFR